MWSDSGGSTSACGVGVCRQVANSWRTTAGLTDSLQATWEGILRVLDNSAGLGRFAGPGGWNNLDLLAVRYCLLNTAAPTVMGGGDVTMQSSPP